MILRDDAFPTIVTAVREGRVIFDNIRRVVIYLLGCNLSEVMIVGFAVLLGMPLPLLPLQILFLNLVTDVFPAFALAMGEGSDDVMQRPPRDPQRPIVADRDWAEIVGHGLAITAATLVAAEIARSWLFAGPDAAVTVSFLTLALAQLWHAFNMADGATRRSGYDWSVVRSPYVWGAIALCIGILLAALHIAPIGQVLRLEPPTTAMWGVILGMSLAPLALAALWRQASRALRRGRPLRA